jgi:hypothetical protein
MQKLNAIGRRLKVIIGILLATAVLVTPLIALGFTINGLFLVFGGYHAEAKVTAIVPVKIGETSEKYYTTVSFVDKRGSLIQRTLNDESTDRYEIGTRLRIIYQEGTRRVGPIVRIDDFWTVWGVAIVMSGVAAASIFLFYLFMKFSVPEPKSRRSKRKRPKKH